MDLRTLTKLVLKLAGIYILVSALFAVPSVVVAQREFWAVSSISLALWFIVGLALLWFPGVVINRVIHVDASSVAGAPSALRILRVGIILLGFFFLITGASRLAFTWAASRFFYSVVNPYPGFAGPNLRPEDFANYTANLLQCALGLLLLVRSKWLTGLVWSDSHDR